MKSIELESWALRVLDQMEKHSPMEDSRVELKKEWPTDHNKAARRIAGHANAARGENILWLIGVDEKAGAVTGANQQDLATWFPQVKACFESEVPDLQDLNVNFKGKTVVALCFDTSRFPYVVKNPKGGEIQFEVPWREGTSVRSATRSDLILMLTPLTPLPKLEVLEAEIYGQVVQQGIKPPFVFKASVYIVPMDASALTYPFHKCNAVVRRGNDTITDIWRIMIDAPAAREEKKHERWAAIGQRAGYTALAEPRVHVQAALKTIEGTEDEVVIRGPGKIAIEGVSEGVVHEDWGELNLSVTLTEAKSGMPVSFSVKCVRGQGEKQATWRHAGATKPFFQRDLLGLF
jgi:hypothetical protein